VAISSGCTILVFRHHVTTYNKLNSWACVVVHVSTSVTVLDVYRDDPEQWLRKVESSPIETAILLFPLLCQQGIGMEFLHEGGEQPSCFLFILQDQNYTVSFFSFLTGNVC
jgi:hypothetical protein